MTARDMELVGQARSVMCRGAFRKLIMEADTEECRETIHNIMCDRDVELSD